MEKFSRAVVIANGKKPIALAVKKQVESFLKTQGISLSGKPQLAITVGGDGTVLFSKKHYGIPFFAIGSGTSFICQARFSDWKARLKKALRRPLLDKRLMLSCSVDGRLLPLALNEIGIRNPEPRVLSIHLQVGRRHYAFRADGILFSTPTGSPAYAYSCGGREMAKRELKYQAVAISPFRRLFSSLMLPSGKCCTLRISGNEKTQLFVDGQTVRNFSEKNSLVITASKKPFYFLKA